ncbi:DPP6 N-terminal domain-like protein [Striga hermonthica]|uniref:DPP6 N-terminal domain-like protein n=1 Tax=Striga hermonthica TaxID=68872 RepID=A0A9N7RFZ4_STRHE|nr:DPP6 N-terminal domain-like protein [Striga hermonthica]
MRTSLQQIISFFFILHVVLSLFPQSQAAASDDGTTTIAFATLGRSSYAFDIYALPTYGPSKETRLTDGKSVNFNGYFTSSESLSMLPMLPNRSDPTTHVLYVSERNGSSRIYLDALYETPFSRIGSRSILESPTESSRFQVPLVGDEEPGSRVSMKDRPSLVGLNLIYVSTHEDPGVPRASWNAVYLTHLVTGSTRRLTPTGVADFSPALSPSGVWTAVASLGEKGWGGEVQELETDIYLFLTQDGSKRVKIVEHGGWPSWADDSTIYFHRRCEDGWWSVFKASFNTKDDKLGVDSVVTHRVTPPGLHAFTPAASIANNSFIALATRRPGSEFRHIELYNLASKKFTDVTRPVSPNAHHYNPFISPDSYRVGYHRCRGSSNDETGRHNTLVLENVRSPLPNVSLFRIDGSFPSYSPDGERVAYVKSPGLYVMNNDGSGLRTVLTRPAFSTAWDWKRKGVVYASVGPSFASEGTKVDIISTDVDNNDRSYKQLTLGGENNAFPSPSPDGKWVVFRSGRTGHKNLYIMDAINGESGGLYTLTEGPWTDTMCNWSPDGVWIAFASDRENPGSGSFEIFKIHPNGTGLEKVIQSGFGGRANHPWFSPDGKHIVFTSDYAGVSAEPISNSHHYQPYGDIFVIKSDGSGIRRLTHNSYEDGTPAWSPKFTRPANVEWPMERPKCSFDDCYWLRIRSNEVFSSSKRQCAE